MKNFFEYLKLLFSQWFLYLALFPELLGFISTYLPENLHFKIPIIYTLIFLIFVFILANFRIWNKAIYSKKAPKVIIDYDFSTTNIIYLEIKNIGSDYAKNITIKFDPDIKNKQGKKINDNNYLKNIPLLEPISLNQNKKIRFWFGTFLDKKFLQKFNIKITYSNLDEKQTFNDLQVIDFSSFIGSSPYKEENKIEKELKNISKHLKESNTNFKNIFELLKNGISLRNLDTSELSINKIKNILKNILKHGNEEDLWLNPYIYDTKYIIKSLRDKLFTKKRLTVEDKRILEQLNILHKHQFYIGINNELDNAVKKLNKILK